ncbi:MAG TPA: hypothetical protein VLQ20_09865 [Planococcus sp. (in: firmicutes)]|nr:hypothetical protein [Planococcus sp. (in: firmicutes)]
MYLEFFLAQGHDLNTVADDSSFVMNPVFMTAIFVSAGTTTASASGGGGGSGAF